MKTNATTESSKTTANGESKTTPPATVEDVGPVKPFHGTNDPELKAQAERLTYRELFDLRIRREGRRDEFDRLVKELVGQGKTVQAAYRSAAEKMGRRTLRDERQLYINHLAAEAYVARKRELAERTAVIRRRRADLAYQNALRSLPATASPDVELDWIRAHPAMSVMDRSTLKGKPRRVLVKERDILHPPHGPAPSQAAVHMLQHWCNRPDDFFSKMIQEQRKGASKPSRGRPREDDDPQGEPDDDTSELDALLGAK